MCPAGVFPTKPYSTLGWQEADLQLLYESFSPRWSHKPVFWVALDLRHWWTCLTDQRHQRECRGQAEDRQRTGTRGWEKTFYRLLRFLYNETQGSRLCPALIFFLLKRIFSLPSYLSLQLPGTTPQLIHYFHFLTTLNWHHSWLGGRWPFFGAALLYQLWLHNSHRWREKGNLKRLKCFCLISKFY